jgi:hypothetical protein
MPRKRPQISSTNQTIKLFNKVSTIPPTCKSSKWLIFSEVRLEFNQSHLKYHTSIDAIVLGGFCPKQVIQYNVLKNDLLKWKISGVDEREQTADDDSTSPDYFSCLPIEVMVHIFQNLDLTSLSRCAQVNKTWNAASMDPTLYQNLSLKVKLCTVMWRTLTIFFRDTGMQWTQIC